jgi:glutamate-5-semialdehyde dehydrogenase
MTAASTLLERAAAAKAASRRLATLDTAQKNEVLLAAAERLETGWARVLSANAADVEEAEALVARGALAQALLDRLRLDRDKVRAMADGIRAVAALPDPAGRVLSRTLLDDGLVLTKVTCPLGVLAVIFESRPDAVTQIAALAFKSGNAALLKGGRESALSTAALVGIFQDVFRERPGVPEGALSVLGGREDVEALLALDTYIDLIVPRGGNALVRYIQEHTRIPVLGHAEGICHVYIDRAADHAMAVSIVLDGKLQYPAACNAVETVLVHREAAAIVPQLAGRLVERGVEVRACERTRALVPGLPLRPAADSDWDTEWSGPTLSMRLVDGLDAAIEHINRHGSGHTDTIVTEDDAAAEAFLAYVDSAGVFHNASTRFADGNRYGFGAEVGISTSKLHARGPVGLEGLVTTKYLLRGHGHVVAEYSGMDARRFRHEPLVP